MCYSNLRYMYSTLAGDDNIEDKRNLTSKAYTKQHSC